MSNFTHKNHPANRETPSNWRQEWIRSGVPRIVCVISREHFVGSKKGSRYQKTTYSPPQFGLCLKKKFDLLTTPYINLYIDKIYKDIACSVWNSFTSKYEVLLIFVCRFKCVSEFYSGTKNEICVSLVYSGNGNKISFPFPLYTRETQISFFVPGFIKFYKNFYKYGNSSLTHLNLYTEMSKLQRKIQIRWGRVPYTACIFFYIFIYALLFSNSYLR